MAHGQITIPIAGELTSVALEGRVVSAEGVYDYNFGESQEQLNRELAQAPAALSGRITQVEAGLQTVQNTQGNQATQISGLQQDVQGMKDNPANKPTINKTWTEMIQLKNSNGFIPGQTYRITDFVTAGVVDDGPTGLVGGYANHPFDLIVTALTSNTLDEDARAALHAGDTYFANCNLEAWRLKYILDPAHGRRYPRKNGDWSISLINSETKGWIYFMEDEHLNSANYDFKNILTKGVKVTDFKYKDWEYTSSSATFKGDKYIKYIMQSPLADAKAEGRNEVFGGLYTVNHNSTKLFYTFSYLKEDGSVIDASVSGMSYVFPYANKMAEIGVGSRPDESENINPQVNLFLCDWEWIAANGISFPAHNTFGQRTHSNTFGNEFQDNMFAHWTNNCVFGNSSVGNVMNYNVSFLATGNYFQINATTGDITNAYVGNLFENNTVHNIFETSFGNRTTYNELGTVQGCTIGSVFTQNIFPIGIKDCTFGDSFLANSGEGIIQQVVAGEGCNNNSFYDALRLTLGNSCSFNRFSARCGIITMGDSCENNVFEGGNTNIYIGDNCCANYFEKNVRYIAFGSSVSSLKGYYYAVTIGQYNDHIALNCTATTSTSNRFMGIRIDSRTYSPYFDNTSTTNYPYKVISNGETEQNYTTTYVNSNSKTINV